MRKQRKSDQPPQTWKFHNFLNGDNLRYVFISGEVKELFPEAYKVSLVMHCETEVVYVTFLGNDTCPGAAIKPEVIFVCFCQYFLQCRTAAGMLLYADSSFQVRVVPVLPSPAS